MIQPRIFIQKHHNHVIPATFGQSMFDSITSCSSSWIPKKQELEVKNKSRHFDRFVVTLQEIKDTSSSTADNNPIVQIIPAPTTSHLDEEKEASSSSSSSSSSSWIIPFARTCENLSMSSPQCPAVYLTQQKYYQETHTPLKKPFVSLSAVAVVTNAKKQILLTRRAAHMRTFPKAWVMPGGSIDSGEGIIEGVIREVKEETGLTVDPLCVKPIGMWESCYPTSGKECIQTGKGLLAHHLVIFCKCETHGNEEICLQEDETDMAIWIDNDDFHEIVRQSFKNEKQDDDRRIQLAAIADSSQSNGEASSTRSISIHQLRGIYPCSNDKYGIAQGNRFMLEEYFR